jgi:hypothetical protein
MFDVNVERRNEAVKIMLSHERANAHENTGVSFSSESTSMSNSIAKRVLSFSS